MFELVPNFFSSNFFFFFNTDESKLPHAANVIIVIVVVRHCHRDFHPGFPEDFSCIYKT